MRSAFTFLAALLAAACALAQAPAAAPANAGRPAALEREPLEGRANQRIERIRIEDSGARIDELRVGGDTQSVTVQPSADVPPYEVLPPNATRGRTAGPRDGLGSPSGQPSWNLLRF